MLMLPPKYSQAKSKHVANDFRIDEVEKFKAENTKVIGVLAEIAARKAELVEKTPFDSFEGVPNRLSRRPFRWFRCPHVISAARHC